MRKGIVLTMVLGTGLSTGAAMQKSAAPDPFTLPADISQSGQHDDDDGHRRMEIQRLKSANAERQRQMAREAKDLLNLAGELQLKAQTSDGLASQAEMFHQAETIEKLAHNVKERMKGAR